MTDFVKLDQDALMGVMQSILDARARIRASIAAVDAAIPLLESEEWDKKLSESNELMKRAEFILLQFYNRNAKEAFRK